MDHVDRNDALAQYAAAVERAGLSLKGKANPYTSHNGHMFSFLGKDGVIAVRLSEADKSAYNGQYGTSEVVSYGAVMRGYVEATESVVADVEALAELIKRGLDFVSTLELK